MKGEVKELSKIMKIADAGEDELLIAYWITLN